MNTKEYISSGIIESYILGLASREEAGIFECVMKNNAEVREAFIETQKMFEDLASTQAVEPPIDLKEKIWKKIQEQEEITSINNVTAGSDKTLDLPNKSVLKISNDNRWKKYAVAASVLFLLSVSANFYWMNYKKEKVAEIDKLQNSINEQQLVLQKVQQKWNLITNPNIQTVSLKGVEKHPNTTAIVFWDKSTKKVYLQAENLPKPPKGMQYQLWAIDNGKPISAGMYAYEKDSETVLAVIQNAQAFAITLEVEGGSQVPTMENMYVIGGV